MQKYPQPVEDESEVIACGSEDCVDGMAFAVGEMAASHAVLVLDVANHGFDGGTPLHHLFYGWRNTALLALGEDPKLVSVGRIMATVFGIGENALDVIAD